MSNKVILWSILILPWLTLFFLKRREIKRYMPLALFTIVTASIIIESGITLGLWSIRETVYPLNQTISYVYGLAPVVAVWVFRYSYGSFLRFIALDSVFNIVFAFFFIPWLVQKGIGDVYVSEMTVFLLAAALSFVLYAFQMWQDDIFVSAEKGLSRLRIRPMAAKPFPRDDGRS